MDYQSIVYYSAPKPKKKEVVEPLPEIEQITEEIQAAAQEITPENYEIPPMLIQPFVENSIWHGLINRDGNGKVKLNISNGQNVICCTIEDNGIGREAAGKINASKKVKRKSMGMSITSERIEIINKLYNIENKVKIVDLYNDNNEPTGTKVIINIPL